MARRKFTPQELKQVEGMAAIRLPMEHIARIMGVGSKDTLESMVKQDAALRSAIHNGRANASGTVRNTLYRLATEERVITEETTVGFGKRQRKVIKTKKLGPDPISLKFWCETQEGFKRTDKIEISGPDGKPIEVKKVPPEKRKGILKDMYDKLKLTEDE